MDELDPSSEQVLIPMEACSHIFHRDCLIGYLKIQVDERRMPFKCPGSECKCEISEDLAKLVFGDMENLQYQDKIDNFSFKNYMESH